MIKNSIVGVKKVIKENHGSAITCISASKYPEFDNIVAIVSLHQVNT